MQIVRQNKSNISFFYEYNNNITCESMSSKSSQNPKLANTTLQME